MPAASLKSMAIRAAQKNIKEVEDLGELPLALATPLIDAVQNPVHLLSLQTKSPHIVEVTSKKWLELIVRDYPSWQRHKIYPKDAKLWWKVYRKAKRDEEARKAAAEAALRKDVAELAAKRVETRTQFVPDLVLPAARGQRKAKAEKPKSAIMSAVLKDVAKHRFERRMPVKAVKPPTKLKYDGLQPVAHTNASKLFNAYYHKHEEELKRERRLEMEAAVSRVYKDNQTTLGAKGLEGTIGESAKTPSKKPRPQEASVPTSTTSTAPHVQAERSLKRPAVSIVRPGKRTRFS